MQITKYEPLHVVKTFKGTEFLIKSETYKLFMQECEKAKFVQIGDSSIAVSSIESVEPAKQSISLVEQMIAGCSEQIKSKVREKVRQRELEKLQITEGIIQNIIESFNK